MSRQDKNYLHLALEDFDEAIKHSEGQKKEYLSNQGACQVELSNCNLALADFNQALELDLNYANVYLNRSIIFNRLNQKSAAVNDLTSYLSINRSDHKIWYECSRLQWQLSKHNQAVQSINNALSLDNNKKEYYHQRARIYSSSNQINLANKDLKQIELIEKMESESPEQLSIR